ncbi:MAG: type II toxin-antitoxin system prevent-host-death family antitoxin [Clostridia bacterium]|nr:type II toxin-antitoxin system prevent-host-death family antitoxin [Clostridia bacterium]
MLIDTKNLVSMTEANQNFSQVVKKVDEKGKVVLLKNNKPKYVITNIDEEQLVLTENEILEVVARRILREHANAFKELSK